MYYVFVTYLFIYSNQHINVYLYMYRYTKYKATRGQNVQMVVMVGKERFKVLGMR